MGRKSLKEDRRKQIVEAFYEVAKKEGLENASLSKIAKHINMPASLLIHYFENKSELLLALTEFIMSHYGRIYISEKTTRQTSMDRLMSTIENIFSRKWNTYFDDGVYYSYFALVFRDDRIRKKYFDLHQQLRQWLTVVIQECNDEGFIKVDNAENVSDLIFVLSEGAYFNLSMVDDMKFFEERLNHYKQQAINLLNIKVPKDIGMTNP